MLFFLCFAYHFSAPYPTRYTHPITGRMGCLLGARGGCRFGRPCGHPAAATSTAKDNRAGCAYGCDGMGGESAHNGKTKQNQKKSQVHLWSGLESAPLPWGAAKADQVRPALPPLKGGSLASLIALRATIDARLPPFRMIRYRFAASHPSSGLRAPRGALRVHGGTVHRVKQAAPPHFAFWSRCGR